MTLQQLTLICLSALLVAAAVDSIRKYRILNTLRLDSYPELGDMWVDTKGDLIESGEARPQITEKEWHDDDGEVDPKQQL